MLILKDFNRKPGIGLAFDVGNAVLELLGIRGQGIAKLHGLNPERDAIHAELHHHAVADGLCQKLVRHVALNLF